MEKILLIIPAYNEENSILNLDFDTKNEQTVIL